MNRSSAYAVLGSDFARHVEQDPALLSIALARAMERGDEFKASALRALKGS